MVEEEVNVGITCVARPNAARHTEAGSKPRPRTTDQTVGRAAGMSELCTLGKPLQQAVERLQGVVVPWLRMKRGLRGLV